MSIKKICKSAVNLSVIKLFQIEPSGFRKNKNKLKNATV